MVGNDLPDLALIMIYQKGRRDKIFNKSRSVSRTTKNIVNCF